jgi:hypothetical protein
MTEIMNGNSADIVQKEEQQLLVVQANYLSTLERLILALS